MGIIKRVISIFNASPNWSRLILGGILTLVALWISSLVNLSATIKYIFPIGLILLILVNWFMYWTEGKNLSAIGFDLKRRNLLFLPFGLLLGLMADSLNFFAKSGLRGDILHFNPDVDVLALVKFFAILLPMAAVQQFLIRSYCFKKVIEMSNVTVANVIFGLIFIAMHNVLGIGIFGMIFYSVTLFISHLLFSTALLTSSTIFFAIGIHWGCNVANDHLFVSGNHHTALFYSTEQVIQNSANGGPSILAVILFLFASNIGYILFGGLIWKWKAIRKRLGLFERMV